jgi:hypothetical protein
LALCQGSHGLPQPRGTKALRTDGIALLPLQGRRQRLDGHKGAGHGFPGLGARQDAGESPTLGQGAVQSDGVPGDPGTDPLVDAGTAGLTAPAGEDEEEGPWGQAAPVSERT